MVEHLAAKDEGLSEIQQENSPCEAMLSIALRAEYMLIRIALVSTDFTYVTGENLTTTRHGSKTVSNLRITSIHSLKLQNSRPTPELSEV